MGRYKHSGEDVLHPLKPIDVVIRHPAEYSVTVVESRKHNEARDRVGRILVEYMTDVA